MEKCACGADANVIEDGVHRCIDCYLKFKGKR